LLPQRRQRHALFGLHLLESSRHLHTLPDGEVLHFGLETARAMNVDRNIKGGAGAYLLDQYVIRPEAGVNMAAN
ncbi:hypothetical protein, partial [Pseudaquabacterium rugosum]